MRKIISLALAGFVLAGADAAAAAHPCDLPEPKRPPSPEMLGQLGVLRAPAGPDDRAPREVRDDATRPYAGAMRRVPLAIGGWVWVVPLFDVSDRVHLTEACIRTAPTRHRARLRRLKRASREIARVEGLQILPYDATGRSGGNANGTIDDVLAGGFVRLAAADDRGRRSRMVGLVPDGVASVRVTLDDYRTGKPKRVLETAAPVSENVFAVEVDHPFGAGLEETVTLLDAAGAVVPTPR